MELWSGVGLPFLNLTTRKTARGKPKFFFSGGGKTETGFNLNINESSQEGRTFVTFYSVSNVSHNRRISSTPNFAVLQVSAWIRRNDFLV